MGLGKRRMKYIQEENRFEEEIIKPAKPIKPLPDLKKVEGEVRMPKSVKPISKKHFAPVMEKMIELMQKLGELQKAQTETQEAINKLLPKGKTEEDFTENPVEEIIKPEEEKK